MKMFRSLFMLFLMLLLSAFGVQAAVIPFSTALTVSATPQPPANALEFIPSSCEVLNAGFIVDASIISTAYCDSGVFTASPITITNSAIRVGNIAASTSSQAHAYVMQSSGAPFTLNSLSVMSFATAIDKKVNQWVVDALKADGTSLTYQYPGSTTSFSFVDMTDIVYLHVYSFRGAFDLYNLDVNYIPAATPVPTAIPTSTPVPTSLPTSTPVPRRHRH